ncbi:uncharacterized protein LOC134716281 isoform X3 [Mytilus trossulus]|uniref:uncharacterized protein LOC134716281 isoform X3 n=1 Tax=Mytilus trossulus TaxID=6551 RepID=UPI0030059300
MMSDVLKSLTRSTTDITFTRGLTFERSSVVAPVVKLKYDVPKSPPNNNIRYKRKVVLSIPVEQKISHRHSLRLLRSSTFMHQDNLDCTVNADSQKVTGVGFGRSYDGEHKRKTKYTETDRHVKSASDDSKHGNRSNSSSTPTVPYSTTDILYGNEVRNSPQLDEIRQNSFIEYSKDKDRHSSNNLVDFNNRRPASKGGSRKSLSIEKVNFNKESDDNLRPILPSPGKNGNQYRPNGLRNGLLKGDPLYGSRGGNYSSGRESDDLIAMGTIWSPNTGPQKNSGSNSANGIQNVTGKSVSMVASNSSTTVARKNVKPIMVNSSSHGRSSFKDVEPRYTDPVIGAQPSFQQRLMELSALESETIRYEKSKKVKKKVRDRDS